LRWASEAFDLVGDGRVDPQLPTVEQGEEHPPAAGAAGPSIYSAVQEQLGLKLESRKGQVEVLVIDHMEKTPTSN